VLDFPVRGPDAAGFAVASPVTGLRIYSRLALGPLRAVPPNITMNIRFNRRTGFTLVEIMIVIAIIGLLAAVAVPNFMRAQRKAKEQVCAMNRDQIDSSKQLWCTENKKSEKDTPSEDEIRVYLKDSKFPQCPGGGTYSINPVDAKCTCTVHAETPQ
jgi:prepilin-type N-terminal cleavage/methylation domain-containing protein